MASWHAKTTALSSRTPFSSAEKWRDCEAGGPRGRERRGQAGVSFGVEVRPLECGARRSGNGDNAARTMRFPSFVSVSLYVAASGPSQSPPLELV